MNAMYHRYIFGGQVTVFGKLKTDYWYGETVATSAEKAKSNLIFQFKKENKLMQNSKVDLIGKIIECR